MEKTVIFDNARFTVLTDALIRIEYSDTGIFEDRPTQIVLNREFELLDFEVIKQSNHLEIITEHVHLYYEGGEFTESSLYADMKFSFSDYANRWYFGQAITGNLGGTTRTLDNIDGACDLESGIMSQNGFAILTDDSLTLTETDDISEASNNQVDLYLFAYGRDYRAALKDYYHLTGPTPLLPRFALGNWWSRFYDYTAETYLALMDKFEAKGIPLSVSVLDMDWHRVSDVPRKYGSGWTGYSWNKKWFPNPKDFIQKLHDKGLTVTLNDHPADGVRAFETVYPTVAKCLGLDATKEIPAVFDFENPAFRAAYFDVVHGALEQDGVDFWWLDWQQGSVSRSGADPLWLLNHYQYRDTQKKTASSIILSRYAGPGSHRYPIGFSGDTIISWASLDFQPYFTNTATNIGYTWWSHDIGGHMNGIKDAELTLRWLQYGVFSPINRIHSSKSVFTSKEPWHFEMGIEATMTKFLRLRHALLPYLYSANVRTATEGRSMIEPMYYEYPLEASAYEVKNQYFFGSELMVAPITQKIVSELQSASVSVWLPEGTWYDFFTGQVYKGNVTLKVFRETTAYPVFAKAGAIVPMDANPLVKSDVPQHIIWKIFPGADNIYLLFEEENETKVEVINQKLKLTEKIKTKRYHTIEFAGRVVLKDVQGDIALDLQQFDPQFDWDFESELLHRLNIAEIAYVEKDKIYAQLIHLHDFDKRMAFVQRLGNQNLKDTLFELIYSDKSRDV
ncbi:MAG: alpha-xylosidase [Carnobacterium sp.]|uniref:glycoside hydrolase family 31 protein n=1 Tax=Lactobacillales TaxID=186826 RepID=UPI00110859BE|nr:MULTISPECIES: TIM-barrel domain-containing protein [Lactobacillales]MBQ6484788.1 alpha-xylosidase [Carnobacterium sp.]TLQ15749.1 alpha-xylosidase [Lactococcus raffinolactis]